MMFFQEMGEYLRRKGTRVPNDPEARINAYLRRLASERFNVDNDVSSFYFELLETSSLIAHFLPKIRNHKTLLRNLLAAYSRRGPCIFWKEPFMSALNRLVSGAKKTPRGRALICSVLFHKNEKIKEQMATCLRKHPDLVPQARSGLLKVNYGAAPALSLDADYIGELAGRLPDITNDSRRNNVLWALARHPKLVREHAEILKGIADNSKLPEHSLLAAFALSSVPRFRAEYSPRVAEALAGASFPQASLALSLVSRFGRVRQYSDGVGYLLLNHPEGLSRVEVIKAMAQDRRLIRRHADLLGKIALESHDGVEVKHAIRALGKDPESAERHSEALMHGFKDDHCAFDASRAIAANPAILVKHLSEIDDEFWSNPARALRALAGDPQLMLERIKQPHVMDQLETPGLSRIIMTLNVIKRDPKRRAAAANAIRWIREAALKPAPSRADANRRSSI